jgi:tetratricopeptide (TPR) repeat protein
LEIKKKILGADHPDLAITYSNMGLLYKALGKYDEAERFMK